MVQIPSPWPSPDELQVLVHQSSGYFIYASTVIKFIDDKSSRPPQQLAVVLGTAKEADMDSPFGPLDALYIKILLTACQDSHLKHSRFKQSRLLKVLCVIANIPNIIYHDQNDVLATQIDQLLELQPDDTILTLRPLHSLIMQNWGGQVKRSPAVGWHHVSFADFLFDPDRSGPFFIDGLGTRMELAQCVLRAFCYKNDDAVWNHSTGHHTHITLYVLSPPFLIIILQWTCQVLGWAQIPHFLYSTYH
jgi:hypothetical protein